MQRNTKHTCTAPTNMHLQVLAHSAVDAAFSGYTGVCVAQVNTHFAMLPIPVSTGKIPRYKPLSFWQRWQLISLDSSAAWHSVNRPSHLCLICILQLLVHCQHSAVLKIYAAALPLLCNIGTQTIELHPHGAWEQDNSRFLVPLCISTSHSSHEPFPA